MNAAFINTESFSGKLREKALRRSTFELLVSRLADSSQESDLKEPTNCGGLGRIRHFKRETVVGWPQNPLPIDPACHRLGISLSESMTAQVFQNAACNWRCWYCFVPFGLLNADSKKSEWLTAEELVRRYSELADRPLILDLSGGQPDLTPEWIPWTMDALENRGMEGRTYLWSDDNLSTDYFWRYLTTKEIDRVTRFRNYGKVGCFKGFDERSFSFNTRAEPKLFDQQFDILLRSIQLGLDVYGYATFTSDCEKNIDTRMETFIDRLQDISPLLPLRVIPLRVDIFTPQRQEARPRQIGIAHEEALHIQEEAIRCWNQILQARFTQHQLKLPIYGVPLQ